MLEDTDASKKRVLEPQYRHTRFGLLREPRHHRIAPGQPETTAETRYEHQDGRRAMAVENRDSAGPPPERSWVLSISLFGAHAAGRLRPTG